ncbi:MAG: DUF5697 family protein [bacterium]|nr:DUF5697 family protein [bacterium]
MTDILIKDIENFVNRLGVVHEGQILQMFADNHNIETVEWCMKELVSKCRINYDRSKKMLSRRQSVNATSLSQQLLTKSAWLLAYMGEESVRDYWPTEYPCQLLIIDEDDTVYDITVFTYQTLSSLRMTVCAKRKMLLPEGVEDEIVHIAVLPDKEMADNIKKLGFDSYCILGERNKPVYYSWED